MNFFDEHEIENNVEISLRRLVSTFIDIAEELVEKDLADALVDKKTILIGPANHMVTSNNSP